MNSTDYIDEILLKLLGPIFPDTAEYEKPPYLYEDSDFHQRKIRISLPDSPETALKKRICNIYIKFDRDFIHDNLLNKEQDYHYNTVLDRLFKYVEMIVKKDIKDGDQYKEGRFNITINDEILKL